MTKNKSVVLLSAGLDSTVNFYAALRETEVKLALTFDYGQLSASQEIARSKEIAEINKIMHIVVPLPWMKFLGQSTLTKAGAVVPSGAHISIDNLAVSQKSAKSVWVPNRNGIFLNIAAGFAESIGAQVVIPGFNSEEALTFPDNSFDFIRATRKSFTYSTSNHVDIQCYTINMNKTEIVNLGKKLLVPFQKLWPCYLNHEKWCGQCESCQRALRAFRATHVDILSSFEKT
jgi:7-cyano-7-deazaguanine synthase